MLFKSTQGSIENSLSRILLVYQVTGVQYFSLHPEPLENNIECRITKNHKIFLITTLLIVAGELCALIYSVFLETQLQHHNNVVTGLIVQFSTYALEIILIITTVLNSLFLRRKAKQIFRNCKNISEIYMILNQAVDYSLFKNEFKRTLSIFVVVFIASTLGSLIFIYQYNQSNIFIWALIAVYPYFFIMMTISYWILLIRLVRENLRFIKKTVLVLNKKHKLFRVNIDIFSHDLRSRKNDETHNVIVKLKRIYGFVYEITSLINELIGIPICLILIVIVIGNISAGYKVFLSMRGDIPKERVAVPFCTIFVSVGILSNLISSCTSTYDTIDEITTIIHKFEFSKYERENGVSTIFAEFLWQIIQRPIEFKVGGFYRLSQPFLATMITGVVTYVMLLAQFYSSK